MSRTLGRKLLDYVSRKRFAAYIAKHFSLTAKISQKDFVLFLSAGITIIMNNKNSEVVLFVFAQMFFACAAIIGEITLVSSVLFASRYRNVLA